VGVLKALARLGIQPDFVAGSSVGSALAALCALEVPPHEMDLTIQRVAEFFRQRSLPLYSLRTGAGLKRAMRNSCHPGLLMDQFAIPCAFIATDLWTGEEVVLRHGLVWQGLCASMSLPGAFPPLRVEGRLLFDGAVACPIPCRAVRRMGADVVIGISLEIARASDLPEDSERQALAARRIPTLPKIVIRALEIQGGALKQQCLQEADVPLRVFAPDVGFDFRSNPAAQEAGERAVEAGYDRLQALLPWVGKRLG
jgi:predicted acylesterase/phospholipase RssA